MNNEFVDQKEQAIRAKAFSLMSGEIGHDFANHLAAIMGYLTLVQTTEGVPAQASVLLTEVERASKRALDLTQQLLAYGRCGTPEKHIVELPIVIGDAIASALHDAPGVVTEFVVPDDLWRVEADAGHVSLIFKNLVVNAIKAMAERTGVLRIVAENVEKGMGPTADSGSRVVHISVTDTGAGIAPGDLRRVFDPFFAANKKSKALGLATVYHAVIQNGGHVEVESTVGAGTTFHVYLLAHVASRTPFRANSSCCDQSAAKHARES